jgi:hypothetical protein
MTGGKERPYNRFAETRPSACYDHGALRLRDPWSVRAGFETGEDTLRVAAWAQQGCPTRGDKWGV